MGGPYVWFPLVFSPLWWPLGPVGYGFLLGATLSRHDGIGFAGPFLPVASVFSKYQQSILNEINDYQKR